MNEVFVITIFTELKHIKSRDKYIISGNKHTIGFYESFEKAEESYYDVANTFTSSYDYAVIENVDVGYVYPSMCIKSLYKIEDIIEDDKGDKAIIKKYENEFLLKLEDNGLESVFGQQY